MRTPNRIRRRRKNVYVIAAAVLQESYGEHNRYKLKDGDIFNYNKDRDMISFGS